MAIRRRVWTLLLACAPALFTLGCSDLGKVDQGRVIAFDKEKGLVTVIRDSAPTTNKPQYDRLPPFTIKVPANPNEMGPAPAAGKRLLFDTDNKQLVVFDAIAGSIKTITYTPLLEAPNVAKDDPRVKGIQFPIVDRRNKAITI
jgi:hypothetical protein